MREREKERERVSECLRQFSPSRFLGLRCHGNYFSQHVAAKPAEDCTYFDKVVVTSTMNKGKREKERRESENRRGEGEGRRKRQVGWEKSETGERGERGREGRKERRGVGREGGREGRKEKNECAGR